MLLPREYDRSRIFYYIVLFILIFNKHVIYGNETNNQNTGDISYFDICHFSDFHEAFEYNTTFLEPFTETEELASNNLPPSRLAALRYAISRFCSKSSKFSAYPPNTDTECHTLLSNTKYKSDSVKRKPTVVFSGDFMVGSMMTYDTLGFTEVSRLTGRAFRFLGVDVATLGNHDFDHEWVMVDGLIEGLDNYEVNGDSDANVPQLVITNIKSQNNSNNHNSNTGAKELTAKRMKRLKPIVVLEDSDEADSILQKKICFVGLITPETIIGSRFPKDLHLDPIEPEAMATELKKLFEDHSCFTPYTLRVVVSHLGFYLDQILAKKALVYRSGDKPLFHIILGGHTHTTWNSLNYPYHVIYQNTNKSNSAFLLETHIDTTHHMHNNLTKSQNASTLSPLTDPSLILSHTGAYGALLGRLIIPLNTTSGHIATPHVQSALYNITDLLDRAMSHKELLNKSLIMYNKPHIPFLLPESFCLQQEDRYGLNPTSNNVCTPSSELPQECLDVLAGVVKKQENTVLNLSFNETGKVYTCTAEKLVCLFFYHNHTNTSLLSQFDIDLFSSPSPNETLEFIVEQLLGCNQKGKHRAIRKVCCDALLTQQLKKYDDMFLNKYRRKVARIIANQHESQSTSSNNTYVLPSTNAVGIVNTKSIETRSCRRGECFFGKLLTDAIRWVMTSTGIVRKAVPLSQYQRVGPQSKMNSFVDACDLFIKLFRYYIEHNIANLTALADFNIHNENVNNRNDFSTHDATTFTSIPRQNTLSFISLLLRKSILLKHSDSTLTNFSDAKRNAAAHGNPKRLEVTPLTSLLGTQVAGNIRGQLPHLQSLKEYLFSMRKNYPNISHNDPVFKSLQTLSEKQVFYNDKDNTTLPFSDVFPNASVISVDDIYTVLPFKNQFYVISIEEDEVNEDDYTNWQKHHSSIESLVSAFHRSATRLRKSATEGEPHTPAVLHTAGARFAEYICPHESRLLVNHSAIRIPYTERRCVNTEVAIPLDFTSSWVNKIFKDGVIMYIIEEFVNIEGILSLNSKHNHSSVLTNTTSPFLTSAFERLEEHTRPASLRHAPAYKLENDSSSSMHGIEYFFEDNWLFNNAYQRKKDCNISQPVHLVQSQKFNSFSNLRANTTPLFSILYNDEHINKSDPILIDLWLSFLCESYIDAGDFEIQYNINITTICNIEKKIGITGHALYTVLSVLNSAPVLDDTFDFLTNSQDTIYYTNILDKDFMFPNINLLIGSCDWLAKGRDGIFKDNIYSEPLYDQNGKPAAINEALSKYLTFRLNNLIRKDNNIRADEFLLHNIDMASKEGRYLPLL